MRDLFSDLYIDVYISRQILDSIFSIIGKINITDLKIRYKILLNLDKLIHHISK